MAQDCQVINQCLILKQTSYEASQFEGRNDIIAVIALDMTTVSSKQFNNCDNLVYAYLPNVKNI